jgi:hypothetical protein
MRQGSAGNYLFLAGSAINGIKNKAGKYDRCLGALAMAQAVQLYKRGVFASADQLTLQALASYARSNGLPELAEALRQRYRL